MQALAFMIDCARFLDAWFWDSSWQKDVRCEQCLVWRCTSWRSHDEIIISITLDCIVILCTWKVRRLELRFDSILRSETYLKLTTKPAKRCWIWETSFPALRTMCTHRFLKVFYQNHIRIISGFAKDSGRFFNKHKIRSFFRRRRHSTLRRATQHIDRILLSHNSALQLTLLKESLLKIFYFSLPHYFSSMAPTYMRINQFEGSDRSNRGDGSYRCGGRSIIIHQPCNATFSLLSRLKRHESKHHQGIIFTVFVHVISGFKPRKSVHRITRNIGPVANHLRRHRSSAHTFSEFLSFSTTRASQAAHFSASVSLSSSSSSVPSGTSFETSVSFLSRHAFPSPQLTFFKDNGFFKVTPHIFEDRCGFFPNALSNPTAAHTSGSLTSMNLVERSSEVLEVLGGCMSGYEARLSKRGLDQSKALEWLIQAVKEKFDGVYEILLARWGVTARHTGTCVLVLNDWRFFNPLDIMTLFSIDNVFLAGSSRAWYSHADHGTSFVRAKVWFDQASRIGLDLDVFLGCASYKLMDASHLCHHEHCIVHVVYEFADLNQDRLQCSRRARFLRGEKRSVSDQCSIHHPSCMMQVRSDDEHGSNLRSAIG